jgi:hypothetical protein
MRQLGQPFCEVCSETLIRSTYGLIRPIQAASPTTNIIHSVVDTQTIICAVQTLQSSAALFTIEWRTNGQAVLSATNSSFTLAGSTLALGTNVIEIVRFPVHCG